MAIYMWKDVNYLCFTANTAGSTVKLTKTGSPTVVSLETSTDGSTWTDYTIWNTITLSNIWDKVYMRNKSNTVTGFSTSSSDYYQFVMSGSINASGECGYLLCKNNTDTASSHCFQFLFQNQTSLVMPPKLSFTSMAWHCFWTMFSWCSNLIAIHNLPIITLSAGCYQRMYNWCSKIKLSSTQTWEYQTEYRIPTTWTGTAWVNSLNEMFTDTWWTKTWTPSINTTYYTSNQVI